MPESAIDQSEPTDKPAVSALRVELLEHMPFSVSSVAIGLTFAGLICYLRPEAAGHDHHGVPTHTLFHLFHPAHMFFSAAATTAMFSRYDRKPLKAAVIGLIGAIGVCGISDIGVPHLALLMMDKHVEPHICIIQNPWLVLPFAVTGVFVGLAAAGGVTRSTLFSHALHVLTSTAASIFYLIAPLDPLGWIDDLGRMFIFVIVAVMVPCCLSDIVFPLLMAKSARAQATAEHCCH